MATALVLFFLLVRLLIELMDRNRQANRSKLEVSPKHNVLEYKVAQSLDIPMSYRVLRQVKEKIIYSYLANKSCLL